MAVGHAELVVCAAPLAHHTPRLVRAILASGWTVSVVASINAEAWLDAEALQDVSDQELLSRPRRPGEARGRPRPTALLAVPATFNTLNKLRCGISDTPALGALNDAVGSGVPLLVVPMISERLVAHPAWSETCTWLDRARVTILDAADGHTGSVAPLVSGTGDAVAAAFDPHHLVDWLRRI